MDQGKAKYLRGTLSFTSSPPPPTPSLAFSIFPPSLPTRCSKEKDQRPTCFFINIFFILVSSPLYFLSLSLSFFLPDFYGCSSLFLTASSCSRCVGRDATVLLTSATFGFSLHYQRCEAPSTKLFPHLLSLSLYFIFF